MAGDWIKMRTDLARDPAVVGIAADTGLDEFAVVGRLHAIWSWADEQTENGNAVSVTETWIDRYISCAGFARSMQKHHWLDISEGGIAIPNFSRHNGKSAKTRALTRKRVGEHRNAVSVTVALPEKRREEKRREEKKEEKRARTPFAKPGLPEVQAYCTERHNAVDPQRFIDHYESNGWRVGRTAMKDWKAAVRTWEKNGFTDNGTGKAVPNRQESIREKYLRVQRETEAQCQSPAT